MNKGRIIILSAPSGGGKTSLARALIDRQPGLAFSISHTTRPPRPGEVNGVDYNFVDSEEFEAMVRAGAFLEHAQVFGSRYGTSLAAVQRLLAEGRDVVLDVDWQGARTVKAQCPDATGVFILPPTRAALESRLRNRRQDSGSTIEQRMRAAVAEMSHYDEFDHVIVNDEFSAALSDLEAIVKGENHRIRPLGLDIRTLFRGQ
jgi:guanylate kinase